MLKFVKMIFFYSLETLDGGFYVFPMIHVQFLSNFVVHGFYNTFDESSNFIFRIYLPQRWIVLKVFFVVLESHETINLAVNVHAL